MPQKKTAKKDYRLFLCYNFYCLLLFHFFKKSSSTELAEPTDSPLNVPQLSKAATEFVLEQANELLMESSLTLLTEIANSKHNPGSINLEFPFDPRILDILTDIHYKEALELLYFFRCPATDMVKILGVSFGDRDYTASDIESYLYYFHDLTRFDRWSALDRQLFIDLYTKYPSTRHAYRRQIAFLSAGLDFEDALISAGLKSLAVEHCRDRILRTAIKATKHMELKTLDDNVKAASDWLNFILRLHEIPEEFPRIGGKSGSPTIAFPDLLPPSDLEKKDKKR